jgi:hypothetical protein
MNASEGLVVLVVVILWTALGLSLMALIMDRTLLIKTFMVVAGFLAGVFIELSKSFDRSFQDIERGLRSALRQKTPRPPALDREEALKEAKARFIASWPDGDPLDWDLINQLEHAAQLAFTDTPVSRPVARAYVQSDPSDVLACRECGEPMGKDAWRAQERHGRTFSGPTAASELVHCGGELMFMTRFSQQMLRERHYKRYGYSMLPVPEGSSPMAEQS